ncbi:hypothetical protein HMPREF1639_07060 [Peptostreptococcus sp. MV1]|uniref:hypothetical protein n=1 Tax=Peptostreptococcus sp. MV1 TaxID=1219626 RepID=UPI00050FD5CE|nr:hypothetical protein [Peptostreptococcus sp. MV1]KGF11528.1 hypothetical protein HMPREF1639_07060 [Peptostreptococcus sp. MV1]
MRIERGVGIIAHKQVTLKSNIKFVIKGEDLVELNQVIKDEDLTLDEVADGFSQIFINTLEDELFGDYVNLTIEVDTKVIDVGGGGDESGDV